MAELMIHVACACHVRLRSCPGKALHCNMYRMLNRSFVFAVPHLSLLEDDANDSNGSPRSHHVRSARSNGSHSSRTFSRAFSNALFPLADNPHTHGSGSQALKHDVVIRGTGSFFAPSCLANAGITSAGTGGEYSTGFCTAAVSDRRNRDATPAKTLKQSFDGGATCVGGLVEETSVPFHGEVAGADAISPQPLRTSGACSACDPGSCPQCSAATGKLIMHSREATPPAVLSGEGPRTHDAHARKWPQRCNSDAGSAARASSRGSSPSRRPSVKGDVVVDLCGVGVPHESPCTPPVSNIGSMLTPLQPPLTFRPHRYFS